MPPVGAYVIALRVMSERCTASSYGPSYVAFTALPPPHQVRVVVARRHRVREPHHPGLRLVRRLQHQRAGPVPPRRTRDSALRPVPRDDLPTAVALVAQQLGEAGGAVEPR